MAPIATTTTNVKPRSVWLNYAVIAVLLTTLFVVGLKLGSGLSGTVNKVENSTENTAVNAANSAPGAAVVNPPIQVRDHTLTDQNGNSLALSTLRGKVTMLFFGYTHCPDVCPTTLADYKLVKHALGAAADQVNFVFVTVDPLRDTPAQIKAYLSAFDTAIIGLTGDLAQLTQIAAEYGAVFTPPAGDHKHNEGVAGDNYFISHTSPSFMIDPDGVLRYVYFYGSDPQNMAAGAQSLLK